MRDWEGEGGCTVLMATEICCSGSQPQRGTDKQENRSSRGDDIRGDRGRAGGRAGRRAGERKG